MHLSIRVCFGYILDSLETSILWYIEWLGLSYESVLYFKWARAVVYNLILWFGSLCKLNQDVTAKPTLIQNYTNSMKLLVTSTKSVSHRCGTIKGGQIRLSLATWHPNLVGCCQSDHLAEGGHVSRIFYKKK